MDKSKLDDIKDYVMYLNKIKFNKLDPNSIRNMELKRKGGFFFIQEDVKISPRPMQPISP